MANVRVGRDPKPSTSENESMTVRELKERLAGASEDGEVQIMVIGETGTVDTHKVDHVGLRDPESHSYGQMPEVVIVSGDIPPEIASQERG
jgi:hypothetical protein